MTPTTDTDLSYPLPVNILGLNEDTERMIAGGAINIDDLLTTDAGGLVRAVAADRGHLLGTGESEDPGLRQVATRWKSFPCFPYVRSVAQTV